MLRIVKQTQITIVNIKMTESAKLLKVHVQEDWKEGEVVTCAVPDAYVFKMNQNSEFNALNSQYQQSVFIILDFQSVCGILHFLYVVQGGERSRGAQVIGNGAQRSGAVVLREILR